ncbi:Putative signal transducing protein [Lysobacter sp. cf310]|nr:Putative signal transducing protein [Lysobacter sp. cf310]
MKIVYRAAHSTDAHLVHQLLEQEGMTAFVNGGLLEGGAGELPMSGLVTVSVADEHETRAREVVREWESMPVPPDDEDEADAPAEAAAAIATPAPRRWAPVLVAALLGTVFGALLTWSLVRKPVAVVGSDLNGDQTPDEHVVYEDGLAVRVETDRNRDGQVDDIVNYDAYGRPTTVESDNDFDGYLESSQAHNRAGWQSSAADMDANGEADYRAETEHGVLSREEWLDAKGQVVKRVRHQKGRAVSGEIDSDGDGKLDTARRYDARGEIVSSSPIAP